MLYMQMHSVATKHRFHSRRTFFLPSEFIHLLLLIPQLLQHPLQLALVLRALLHPTHGLVQPGRSTHEDFPIRPILGLEGQHRLQQLLGHVALGAALPVLGRVVEEVEGAEALRVGVLEVGEFFLEEDVFFGEVAEDEGYFGFVVGVVEDGAGELVHPVSTKGFE